MKNRTNPIGVRFDIEKLAFIKQREKLESNQQVVDLLVNKYWWEWKMPIPTHKEVPPDNLKEEKVYQPPKEIIDPLQDWKDDLNNCESGEEINYVGQKIATSGLSRHDQNVLNKFGKMICEKKGFI